jgi:hypothetical protein
MTDYDAVGFEADHCLVKYNVKKVTELIVDSFLKDLCSNFKGYPAEMVNFDYD